LLHGRDVHAEVEHVADERAAQRVVSGKARDVATRTPPKLELPEK
jgi:hypothetical protein